MTIKVFDQYIRSLKNQIILRKEMRSIYIPVVSLVLVLILTCFLLYKFVFPGLYSLYSSKGRQWPYLTNLLSEIIYSIGSNAHNIFFFVFVLISAVYILRRMFLYFDILWGWFILQLPIVATLHRQLALNRFLLVTNSALSNGFPVQDVLVLASSVLQNSYYKHKINKACMSMKQGDSLFHSLSKTGLFTKVEMQILHVGERAGDIESSFAKVFELSEDSVLFYVSQMKEVLNLFITLFLASFAMFIYVAVYMGYMYSVN